MKSIPQYGKHKFSSLKVEPNVIAYKLSVLVIAFLAFIVYFYTAYRLPGGKSVPDEAIRRMIPFYLVQNNKLPTGFETELNCVNDYGFSYASYPPFPALISAFFIKIATLFTDNQRLLIISSRLGNVLLGVVSVVYLMKIGNLYFKSVFSSVLMALLVGFMPQVIFISSYFNADSIALCSAIMILYYLVLGNRQGWSVKTCIKLAVSMSICILTYYNAYGWCLIAVIYCVASVIRDPGISGKARFIFRRSALIAAICIALTGWYFIRNGILYDGDFLAINIRNKIAQTTAAEGFAVNFCSPYADTGKSLLSMLFSDNCWLETTIKSTIGVFSAMSAYLPDETYAFYEFILVLGAVCAIPFCIRDKNNRLLYILLLFCSATVIGLSIYYSYRIDYQPQGRYIISVLPAAAIFEVTGYRELGKYISSVLKAADTRQTTEAVYLGLILSWLFTMIFVNSQAEADDVFTENKLIYEIQSESQQISFVYYPSENEQFDSVSFAIWNSSDAPTWYTAQNDGSAWVVEWPYDQQEYGDYNIHIYTLSYHRQPKNVIRESFSLENNSITADGHVKVSN